jgi:thiosulfate sulfurtransferase
MPFKRISIDEAKVLIDNGGVTVADVRDAGAYNSSHIENAIHVQQETLEDFLAVAQKDKPLVIYCYHGNSSQGAADYFDGLGFSEVYSVDGGFEAWRAKY